jgi:hypothetical protein
MDISFSRNKWLHTSLDLESLSISVIKPFVNFSDLITEGKAITIN